MGSQTSNVKRQTSSVKRQASNVKRQASNVKRQGETQHAIRGAWSVFRHHIPPHFVIPSQRRTSDTPARNDKDGAGPTKSGCQESGVCYNRSTPGLGKKTSYPLHVVDTLMRNQTHEMPLLPVIFYQSS